MTLKLFHNDKLIGTITDASADDTHDASGRIQLTEEGKAYRHVFDYFADENAVSNGAEMPFDESFVNGWYIKNQSDERTEILWPVVDRENNISWRE